MSLVNRVAQSSLITFKLEDYIPKVDFAHFDIKDYLFKELLLKEADFRATLKEHDWTQYAGKVLLVYCSSDAIVPMWASMLIATYAGPIVEDIFYGNEAGYYENTLLKAIDGLSLDEYQDGRLVIKGCADYPINPGAYLKITQKFMPVAKSIMFGEPCSTVPLYKRKKQV